MEEVNTIVDSREVKGNRRRNGSVHTSPGITTIPIIVIMTPQEQTSEGQGECPKEKQTMVIKKERIRIANTNKPKLNLLHHKMEAYFAEYIISFFSLCLTRNYIKLVNIVVRTLQRKPTKLFHGITTPKTRRSQGRGQEEETPWEE